MMTAQLALVGEGFPEKLVEGGEPHVGAEFSLDHNKSVYDRLVKRAVEVFGDEETASRWLSSPSRDLDGKTPTQVAQESHFDRGILAVKIEPILTRIENGIYY